MQTKKRALRNKFETIILEALRGRGTESLETLAVALADKLADAAMPEKNVSAQAGMFGAVSFITMLDPELNKGQIAKFAAALLKIGATPEKLVRLYWTKAHDHERLRAYGIDPSGKPSPWCADWRSKSGKQAPNERDIRGTVGAFLKSSEPTPEDDVIVLS